MGWAILSVSWLSSVLRDRYWNNVIIRPHPHPSTSFPIHYSLIVGRTPSILTEGFPQPLQANARLLLSLGYYRLFLNSLKIIIHQSSYHRRCTECLIIPCHALQIGFWTFKKIKKGYMDMHPEGLPYEVPAIRKCQLLPPHSEKQTFRERLVCAASRSQRSICCRTFLNVYSTWQPYFE
jgi:hypothetical protein